VKTMLKKSNRTSMKGLKKWLLRQFDLYTRTQVKMLTKFKIHEKFDQRLWFGRTRRKPKKTILKCVISVSRIQELLNTKKPTFDCF